MQKQLLGSAAAAALRGTASHSGAATATARASRAPIGPAAASGSARSPAPCLPTALRVRSLHASSSRLAPKEGEKDAASAQSLQPPKAAKPAAEEPAAPGRATSLFDIDTSTSSLVAAAEEAADGSGGDGSGKKLRTGAKGRRTESSIDRRRRTRTRVLLGLMGIGLAATVVQAGRELDEREAERFKDNPSKDSFFGRVWLRATSMKEDLNAPAWEKLLPDPLPFPYGRPYTLVVDLDGLMTHSSWTRERGWRTAKRPGLDYFLGYLAQWYEIVLYTSQPFYTAGPIIEKLDPDRRFLAYLLFRESCRTVDGKIVKDLDALNRDLNKVVVLDTTPDGFALHPQNGILVKKWEGERDDRELIALIPFLEAIGIYDIPNVRNTIEAYKGTHIPTEHARRTLELRAREYEQWKAKKGKAGSGFASLVKGGAGAGSGASDAEFKTWYERESERYQAAYAEDEKYWREHGDEIRRQAKEDQERQLKEMKTNAWGFLTGAAKPADAPAANA